MKILQEQASYKILTSEKDLKKQLINIEKAGRTCYQSEKKPITERSAKKFIAMLLSRGHESVIEHSILTVQFNNLSRGFTHELVRHRLASFSQESTRYVDYAPNENEVNLDKFKIKIVIPPKKKPSEKFTLENGKVITLKEMLDNIEMFYRGLRKAGWRTEEARQLLPIGIKAQIVVSANLREWRHIFHMRTSKRAHWEIRSVMVALLKELQEKLKPLFDDFVKEGKDEYGIQFYKKVKFGNKNK